MTLETIQMQRVKDAQPQYFTKENKRFFHDISYSCKYGKKSGNLYFITHTNKWSDLFGGPQQEFWIVKIVGKDYELGSTIKDFDNKKALVKFLKTN